VHWHGIILPNGMDGVAGLTQKPIAPGETFVYEFTVRHPGTYMYHPHFDEMTQIALGMAGMFIAIYAVQVLLRLRSEEATGTAESVLAAEVPRSRLVLAHVLNAAIGSLLLVEVFAVSMALATGAATGDPTTQVAELAPAALVQVPAILAIAMAVVTLIGLLPRAAVALSWLLLVTTFVIGPMFGPGLGLPDWVQDLSPFTHVPMLPAADLSLAPLAVLSVVAVALAATGTAAFRHRDLALPA